MNFCLHIPENPVINHYISCVWEFHGGERYEEYIIPKGIVEVIFNLAEPIRGKMPYCNKFIKAPVCFIQGVHNQPVVAKYSGMHHLFGIRFKPYVIQEFFRISPAEIKNRLVDIFLIQPEFRDLWNRLGEAKNFQERVAIVENSLKFHYLTKCSRSVYFCNLFYSDKINAFESVDKLAGEVCYSSRQLSRKSHQFFGLSAEELVLYKKYLHAVRLMHHKPARLIDIALESGFYDQPHFNRAFKYFTGLTPREYQHKKTDLPFHLFLSNSQTVNLSD